jgi:DNA (cytosine-5)-methyltransferase 1
VGQDGAPLNALCFGGGNTSGEIDVATCLTHHHTRQDFDTETFAVVGPLCANVGQHGHTGGGQQAVEAGHVVAHAVGPLCTRSGGHTEQQAVEAGHIVTHALTARHDSSPDGTGRGVPLVTTHQNTGRGWWNEGPVAQAVRASGGGGPLQANVVAYRPAAAGAAYSFQPRIGRSGRGQPSEVVPALAGAGADAGATSDSRPCVAVAGPSYAVRRLTPRECERLQGFPDDYTLIEFRGKPASDGARYRALGNSMAVPVMAWIGRRIDLVDMLLEAQ